MAKKEESKRCDEKAAGMTLAGVIGGLYAICYAGYVAAPDFMLKLGGYLFHGVALETRPLSFINALVGLAAWLVIGFAAGAGFAWLYNRLSSR